MRGTILLSAESVFEDQVVKCFLEAAEYKVISFPAMRAGPADVLPARFDAAVAILDRWDSNLARICRELRESVSNPQLPIVIIGLRVVECGPHCLFLARPVRLFDLVETIEALRDRPGWGQIQPPIEKP